ncbi:MAG: chorismate synthase [Candidatus Altiarchaeota archaeon]
MNTIGRMFRLTTWGESHGTSVGAVVDGCPSGLALALEDIQMELDRRRPGQSSLTTSRTEEDIVEIHSGLFEGKTLGTPIMMIVHNRDADSSKYIPLKDTPRPGHADLTWREKFGHVDWRGGGRSSARETVGRVAGGAVAKKLLKTKDIEVIAFTRQIGSIVSEEDADLKLKGLRELVDSNPVRALDIEKAKEMEELIEIAKKQKDSVGGVIEVHAVNVPTGLGEPVFGKLTSDLAGALASIPAVKGVEFGAGFKLAEMRGSEANDEFTIEGNRVRTKTNNSGGIQGGISNGMPIIMRVAVKPTSSMGKEQSTVNLQSKRKAKISVEGRHDPCIVPRAVPIVEAMVSLIIADHCLIAGLIPRRL